MGRLPLFHLRMQEIAADGRKNSRFMARASAWAIFAAIVSQRIRILPPPVPKPDRNPNTVAMGRITQRDSIINTGSLPR
jgi:hypothetical protein